MTPTHQDRATAAWAALIATWWTQHPPRPDQPAADEPGTTHDDQPHDRQE